MKVTLFQCGPFVNESERRAAQHLKTRLQSEPGNDHWVLLTGLAFSVTHQLQSADIDIVAIGPQGVRVIEVKHWTSSWVESHTDLVAQEADKAMGKARKIGTTLRRLNRDLPRVDAVVLVTQESAHVKRLAKKKMLGVQFHRLSDWKSAVNLDSSRVLSPQQVMILSQSLEPKVKVALDGSMRRLAGYVNLELQTPKEERFHRVYRGTQPSRRDRVILHLYDLSASDDKNAEEKAKREFDALHRLQLFPWVPRILDSYQDAPGYAGEMFFFTMVDPAAPSIQDRAADKTWDTTSRVAFARAAAKSLHDLHRAGPSDEPFIHRNLHSKTILVKHDNSPIFIGLDRAKIPSDVSVASSGPVDDEISALFAPEVRTAGLSAADQRSDVYGFCNALMGIFEVDSDTDCERAREILSGGTADDPSDR